MEKKGRRWKKEEIQGEERKGRGWGKKKERIREKKDGKQRRGGGGSERHIYAQTALKLKLGKNLKKYKDSFNVPPFDIIKNTGNSSLPSSNRKSSILIQNKSNNIHTFKR